MRILVGTLYTLENEFDECVAAIEQQTYRDFELCIIDKLSNKEAHDTLYRMFMARSEEFDLMIKVDADMVIEDRQLFEKIVQRFEVNAGLKDLEIAVHDFFSNRLIWGMHTYRNTVKWQPTEENLFVDACPLALGEKIHDDSELAPAAIHCKNPSHFQAFRYGVHRALKTIQPGRVQIEHEYSVSQWSYLESTRRNYKATGDKRVGYAVLGAELTFGGGIQIAHYDFSNPFLESLFQQYNALTARELKREIGKLMFRNFGFLPGRLRRKVLLRVSERRTEQNIENPSYQYL
jgi:hypothetical protein